MAKKPVTNVKLVADLTKLGHLKEGDIVVVKLKGKTTERTAKVLIKQVKETFPHNKSLVLSNGASLFPLSKRHLNNLGWFEKEK